jgi:hypothetical protein
LLSRNGFKKFAQIIKKKKKLTGRPTFLSPQEVKSDSIVPIIFRSLPSKNIYFLKRLTSLFSSLNQKFKKIKQNFALNFF